MTGQPAQDTSTFPMGTPSAAPESQASPGVLDRPLPFLLLRCVEWLPFQEPNAAPDGYVKFWMRAGLTGRSVFTGGGRDTNLSDLEVS